MILGVLYVIIGLVISVFINAYAKEAYGSITDSFYSFWSALLSPVFWPFIPIIVGILWVISFSIRKIEALGAYTAKELKNPRGNVK